jgi:hypothetical protein
VPGHVPDRCGDAPRNHDGPPFPDSLHEIEEHNPDLDGGLPKACAAIDNGTIASLLRHINSYTRRARIDSWGRGATIRR